MNCHISYPAPAPAIPTGLAGFDAIAGGLHGITVITASSHNLRGDFALGVILGAMECNPGLGAVICRTNMPDRGYITTLAALRSGIDRWRIAEVSLNSAEQDRLKWAQTRFENGLDRRLRFLEPLTHRPENYTHGQSLAAQILDKREELFGNGGIDRCLVMIDALHLVAAPIPADSDMVDSDDQDSRAATDFEKSRRPFTIVEDVWAGMSGPNGRPQDPVLAVAGTHSGKQPELTPDDIRGQLEAEATAVGLLHLPPADGYRPDVAGRMDLDVYVGCSEEPKCVPLLYDHATCRFRDALSNAPLGW